MRNQKSSSLSCERRRKIEIKIYFVKVNATGINVIANVTTNVMISQLTTIRVGALVLCFSIVTRQSQNNGVIKSVSIEFQET